MSKDKRTYMVILQFKRNSRENMSLPIFKFRNSKLLLKNRKNFREIFIWSSNA